MSLPKDPGAAPYRGPWWLHYTLAPDGYPGSMGVGQGAVSNRFPDQFSIGEWFVVEHMGGRDWSIHIGGGTIHVEAFADGTADVVEIDPPRTRKQQREVRKARVANQRRRGYKRR